MQVWAIKGNTWPVKDTIKSVAGMWWNDTAREWIAQDEATAAEAARRADLSCYVREARPEEASLFAAAPEAITEDGNPAPVADVEPAVFAAQYSQKQIQAVIKSLRPSGTLGYDSARPGTKARDLEAIVAGGWTTDVLRAAFAAATNGVPVPKPAPVPVAADAPQGSPVIATPAPGSALADLEKAIREIASGAKQSVDANQVRAIAREEDEKLFDLIESMVREAAEKAAGRQVTIQVADRPKVTFSGVPPWFEKLVRLTTAGVNVLLVGPAGSGKTHACEMLAKVLNAQFASLSCSAGVTESALTGRAWPIGGGRYLPSPFVNVYTGGQDGEAPGVFLFDEIDAADPNLLLVVNTALANGHIEIDARVASDLPTRVNRGKNVVLVAAANTFGTGADMQYVGRSQLDAATLDRFYIIRVDYDRDFEKSLFAGAGADAENLGNWVWALREKVRKNGLRRVVSTRMIQKGLAALRAGVPLAETKADLLAGWSADELSVVGA